MLGAGREHEEHPTTDRQAGPIAQAELLLSRRSSNFELVVKVAAISTAAAGAVAAFDLEMRANGVADGTKLTAPTTVIPSAQRRCLVSGRLATGGGGSGRGQED